MSAPAIAKAAPRLIHFDDENFSSSFCGFVIDVPHVSGNVADFESVKSSEVQPITLQSAPLPNPKSEQAPESFSLEHLFCEAPPGLDFSNEQLPTASGFKLPSVTSVAPAASSATLPISDGTGPAIEPSRQFDRQPSSSRLEPSAFAEKAGEEMAVAPAERELCEPVSTFSVFAGPPNRSAAQSSSCCPRAPVLSALQFAQSAPILSPEQSSSQLTPRAEQSTPISDLLSCANPASRSGDFCSLDFSTVAFATTSTCFREFDRSSSSEPVGRHTDRSSAADTTPNSYPDPVRVGAIPISSTSTSPKFKRISLESAARHFEPSAATLHPERERPPNLPDRSLDRIGFVT